jgi:BirA family transcriptional regulator, biotin operon repressor / biotin---[acetyl-CoA-carboxylase] ligase
VSVEAPALPAGWRLVAYDLLGSTNDTALQFARDGAAAFTIVWARAQTEGRGRRGRRWSSPPGNLYASLILRPHCPVARAAQLGFVAAVAIGDALLPWLPDPAALAYKWPNDILIDGKKLAGILLEAETQADFVVVGFGVNLVSAPGEAAYPTTCLAGAVGPEAMLTACAAAFRRWFDRWQEAGFAPVREAWRARAQGLGAPIAVRRDEGDLHGRFIDIDQEGALLLECAGETRRIVAGDVFPAIG